MFNLFTVKTLMGTLLWLYQHINMINTITPKPWKLGTGKRCHICACHGDGCNDDGGGYLYL